MTSSKDLREMINPMVDRRGFLTRILSAGVLCGTGLPNPSIQDELTWNPSVVCPLSNPRVVNIGATGGTVSLSAGQHAIVTLNGGTGRVDGKVTIMGVPNGGNRVRIIGGSIRNVRELTGNSGACLDIHNIDIAYVEGVRCDKADKFGDAFIFRGQPGGTLYLQNCLAIGPNYDTVSTAYGGTGIHGDALQLQSQVRAVYIDKFTAYTWAQSFLSGSSFDDQYVTGPSILKEAVFKRYNVHIYDTNLNPKPNPARSHNAVWAMSSCTHKKSRFHFENAYLVDEQKDSGRHTLSRLVTPGTHYSPTASCAGGTTGDAYYGTWIPSSTLGWTGKINGGMPPDGDYVPRTFSGLNYQSPGYV